MGNINYKGCDKPQNWWVKNAKWISRLFTDSAFVAKVKKRWTEKKKVLIELETNGLQALADANAASAECNFMKWDILGKYVWPNPAGYGERKTYQSEVDYLKNAIRTGVAYRSDIERCTERLGDAISAVYGFELPQPERQAERGQAR